MEGSYRGWKGPLMDSVHTSVLTNELVELLGFTLSKKEHSLMIDATLGEGGHTERFLREFPGLSIVGLDADPRILEKAKTRLQVYGNRVRFYNIWFNQFFRDYPLGGERPDIILFDLGISMFHYQQSKMGFSFKEEEPLDMRISPDLELSAADIVNTYPEKELADLIYQYGEERFAKRIAHVLIKERRNKPVLTNKHLAEIICNSVPAAYRYSKSRDSRSKGIRPETRTFQALRIAVNGELARLEAVLPPALNCLLPGGRMGAISFHSLEDRIVKHFFKHKNKTCICPPDSPICKCDGRAVVSLVTKKPVRPSKVELSENKPSRSARLRVVEKLPDEDR